MFLYQGEFFTGYMYEGQMYVTFEPAQDGKIFAYAADGECRSTWRGFVEHNVDDIWEWLPDSDVVAHVRSWCNQGDSN